MKVTLAVAPKRTTKEGSKKAQDSLFETEGERSGNGMKHSNHHS